MDPILEGLIEAILLLGSTDPEVIGIMILSLRVSGTAVIFSSLAGIPIGAFLGLKGEYFGKRVTTIFINTCMGLPPVVIGLLVFLTLSRSGPLGLLGLLYTPTAMILSQFVLTLPIIIGITMAAVASVEKEVRDTATSLGATESQLWWTILSEARLSILAAVIVAFGQAISEVGSIMIVGGNIRFHTRALTTAIVLQTRQGEFGIAIALGIILISLAFTVNIFLTRLQVGRR